ncbi:MAG: type II toxin-antitoxin system VapC family toxin [Kiritimatiellae bacterium]|nr:type II toxin-antitoxin system VapC family toxin [Kiritimatiellia bacterium]
MIVVDVNILAAYLIQGPQTTGAHALRRADADWVVPSFWCIEFQSVLWKYVRQGGMPEKTAFDLLDKAVELFASNECPLRRDDALRTAFNRGITVYDAQYVCLANRLGVPCVTEDAAVRRACSDVAVSLSDFLARDSGGDMVSESRPAYRLRGKTKRRRKPNRP